MDLFELFKRVFEGVSISIDFNGELAFHFFVGVLTVDGVEKRR